jgi:endonuclease-3
MSNLVYNNEGSNIPRGRHMWEWHWKQIETVRGIVPADIDTMGAQALAGYVDGPQDDSGFRFQTLVGTMLSPQTKDEQTSAAFYNLVKLVAPDPLLPSTLAKKSIEDIESNIRMVSFFRNKAIAIHQAAVNCRDEFNNDIPRDIKTLMSFRGVGPKVGFLTLTIAWGETTGICVDTHVHRLVNRLGWVDTIHQTPEHTRIALESFLPKSKWAEVNFLFVGFGQSVCKARGPKCEECPLQPNCLYFNDKQHMKDENGQPMNKVKKVKSETKQQQKKIIE